MAQRKEDTGRRTKRARKAKRHPLLVYHNLGRRYRPMAVLFVLVGVILLLPSLFDSLDSDVIAADLLGIIGIVVILVGLALWLFSILAKHRAYVEVSPEILTIRTPFYRTLVSYRRVKQAQPVQVSQIFPRESLKGMGRPLVKPLLGMTAVELHVKSWPAPKRRLQRFMSPYLFSPRSEAWMFIVPNYSLLIRQLDAALNEKVDAARRPASTYQDPIERLRRG
ncbi:MAG: hypothetical protein GX573_15685 [Chloroflexi bacterium]|nr:hypothetical protein [Chloroflexota bacterium]